MCLCRFLRESETVCLGVLASAVWSKSPAPTVASIRLAAKQTLRSTFLKVNVLISQALAGAIDFSRSQAENPVTVTSVETKCRYFRP